MGFKISTVSFAIKEGKLVFDNERQALACPKMVGDEIFLIYQNGGMARLVRDSFLQLKSEELPWVPTEKEAHAWKEGSDKKIPREKIIFAGTEIPKDWWGKEESEPEEWVLSFA